MNLIARDLAAFYATPLGLAARRILRRRLRDLWPDVRGANVLGLGYALPLLRPLMSEAARVVALMPASQGASPWPQEGPNRTALIEDRGLPLPDESFDRILIVHGLDLGDGLRPLLRETWRVLAPGGRVMIIAPNRRGLWALAETTPFGHGQPFSRGQLLRLLSEQMYTPTQWAGALHLWPVKQRWLLRFATGFERLGAQWLSGFAGVHMVEASKQIYGVMPAQPLARSAPARVLVVETAHSTSRAAFTAPDAPSTETGLNGLDGQSLPSA